MKHFCVVPQFLIFMFCLLDLPVLLAQEKQEVTLSYLENGLSEIKRNENQVALQFLANELIRGTDLTMRIKPVKTFAEMQGLITSGEVEYVIFNSFYYITHFDFFQKYIVEPIWAIQRGSSGRESYIVVAQKTYTDLPLVGFRGKTISFYPQYLLMKHYLNYLIKKTTGLESLQFFKKIKSTRTASQAVLDVYFGVSDLCIVPKHIFDLTVELNPAILQKLVIKHQSEEIFFPALSLSFKHIDSSIRNSLNANMSLLDQTARGQKILEMFNIYTIKSVTREELQPMHEVFQNFLD